MKIESYVQGTPSWVDLGARDREAAKSFYSNVFGWSYEDTDMDGSGSMIYSMATLDGAYVAAIYTQQTEEVEMGIPPHWNTYLAVEDVDAATARVSELGGNVMNGPFDVFDSGRMSVISDPTGGMILIWQAKNHIGAGVKHEHGSLTWSELLTPDPKAAASFFEGLLGVKTETGPVGDSEEYTMVMVEGEGVAGIMKMPDHLLEQNVPAHWEPYFEVDDVDALASEASSAGGELLLPPQNVEGAGRLSVVKDPQGAVFGMIKQAPMS